MSYEKIPKNCWLNTGPLDTDPRTQMNPDPTGSGNIHHWCKHVQIIVFTCTDYCVHMYKLLCTHHIQGILKGYCVQIAICVRKE